MADHLTIERRSALMSTIKSSDTRPEILVRKALHAMGYRFRLHVRKLPGAPLLQVLGEVGKTYIQIVVFSSCRSLGQFAIGDRT